MKINILLDFDGFDALQVQVILTNLSGFWTILIINYGN